MHRISLLIGALLMAAMPLASYAQQPGSVDYNRVFLPAHGAGDVKQPRLSWGSFAMSDANSLSGWGLNAASEKEARNQALSVCAQRGGTDCEVLFVFADSCAAIAVNDSESFSSAGGALEDVRRESLRRCGAGCEIFQERCSLPGR